MGKKNKNKYYAWILPDGTSGICESWDECQAACLGHHGEKHKSFATHSEAWQFAYPGVPKSQEEEAQFDAAPITAGHEEAPWVIDDAALSESADEAITEEVIAYCVRYGFEKLSDAQKKAVQSVEGKTLLFAVPGSGKTTVLIARTGYMICSRGISPRDIMSLTFTKAAAVEMDNRFRKHFNAETVPDFRTIHSLCYSIILPLLKKSGFDYPEHFIGQDAEPEEEGKNKYLPSSIFREVFKKLKIGTSDLENNMEEAQVIITGIKNSMMAPQSYENRGVRIGGKDIPVAALFETYQNILKERNCIDFDDLLIYALKGLQQYPGVLHGIRNRYKYWSVDEAQDNSLLQFKLLDLLCGESGNMFMVGDDDQSIYSFRGANPHYLIQFGKRPDVKTLLMGTNYRSDYDIVNTAKSFVEANYNREQKMMEAFSADAGDIVIPRTLSNEAAQYAYVVNAAKEAIAKGETLAVLYRRNISGLPLIVKLHQEQIDYESNKGINEILRSKNIKVIWRIMRFAMEPSEIKTFYSCNDYLSIHLNKDEKAILEKAHKNASEKNVLDLIAAEYQKNNSDGQNDYLVENVSKIRKILGRVKEMTPSEAAMLILEEFEGSRLENIGDRLRIYSFLSVCDLFKTIPDLVEAVNDIAKSEKRIISAKDSADLDESTETVTTSEKPLITLSTMHSSKGREFDRVIIIDTFDEIMPGAPRDDALLCDPEEERRLFYVAVTRAAHRLDLLTIDNYHGNPERISRFVTEVAYLYETGSQDTEILTEVYSGGKSESSTYIIKPKKYYAVRAGRVPGVYTSWNECRAQIDGYSGSDCRVCDSMEEAEEYAAVPKKEKPLELKTDSIDRHFVSSAGVSFNYPLDIPDCINTAIYRYFGVRSLADIEKAKLDRLIEMSRPFGDSTSTDYSERTEAYMLAYMPVNFFKVWKPLRDLISRGKLPVRCKVLELGAGPGTSTLGLLYFYMLLAEMNPEQQFEVEITAIEREDNFRKLFDILIGSICKEMPANLHATVEFVNADAFDNLPQYQAEYDILLESNMLNIDEDISTDSVESYISVLKTALNPEGVAVLIEPGKKENVSQLNSIANETERTLQINAMHKAQLLATDTSGILLLKDAVNAGLRYSKKAEHWFSYLVLENEVVS